MKISRSWRINKMSNLNIFNGISSINSFPFNRARLWRFSFRFITYRLLRSVRLIFISNITLRISYFCRWFYISLFSTINLGWICIWISWILTILSTLYSSCSCSCCSFICLGSWSRIGICLISIGCGCCIWVSWWRICYSRWALISSCCRCCCGYLFLIKRFFCNWLLTCNNFFYYFCGWIWLFFYCGICNLIWILLISFNYII